MASPSVEKSGSKKSPFDGDLRRVGGSELADGAAAIGPPGGVQLELGMG
jgi:hypothetical protein